MAREESQSKEKSRLTPAEQKEKFCEHFGKTAKCLNVEHQCHECGKHVEFVKFRDVGAKMERLCIHNVNLDIVYNCKAVDKNAKVEYESMYTDWHRLLEYTSNVETNLITWIPDWWNKQLYGPTCTKAKLTHGIKRIMELESKCKIICQCKKKYFEEYCKIDKVNEWVLQADLRYLHFYRKCLIYWLKLNKSVFWKDEIAKFDIECHACGMQVYSETQYCKMLTSPYARNKMQHIEWVDNDTMAWFVCEWCVYLCWVRSRDAYTALKQKSDMYPEEWCGLKHWEQTIFAIGHLDGRKHPIHLAWYSISQQVWYHGSVTQILDNSKGIIQVLPLENVPKNREIMKISIANMHKYQYFLYSRPSTTLSPLYIKAPNEKISPLKLLKNDEYIIDTTCQRWKKQWTKSNLLPKGRDQISNGTVVRIIRNGIFEETYLQSIKKNKDTFEVFKKKLPFFE